MIDYELAKELKDAGFPQRIDGGESFFYYRKNRLDPQKFDRTQYDTCCVLGMEEDDDVYEPSLSELIETCERLRDFYLYRHFVGGEYSVEWEAVLIKRTTEDGQLHEYQNKAKGVTPEEAVARLWLELNKKS